MLVKHYKEKLGFRIKGIYVLNNYSFGIEYKSKRDLY